VLLRVAGELGITSGKVFGVATFYSHFTMSPKGQYIIRVCDGTACHVRKSEEIIKTVREEIKLPEGKNTSEDNLFTLETVACLGACGLAPVVVVNEEVHGSMTREKTIAMIKEYREKEAAGNE
jgi:NADH-quinone oxidoreductase subunit E